MMPQPLLTSRCRFQPVTCWVFCLVQGNQTAFKLW